MMLCQRWLQDALNCFKYHGRTEEFDLRIANSKACRSLKNRGMKNLLVTSPTESTSQMNKDTSAGSLVSEHENSFFWGKKQNSPAGLDLS